MKGALSKSSTIGPPFVWAVPTVGHVIDKEALMHILKGCARRESTRNSPSPCAAGTLAAAARGGTTVPPAACAVGVRSLPLVWAMPRTPVKFDKYERATRPTVQVECSHLPHAGRCLNPVGEAAPRSWRRQRTSRRAPSAGSPQRRVHWAVRCNTNERV